jgi:hypothetical protein
MEFIESERGNQKLKIKLKTICGGQLSGGYCLWGSDCKLLKFITLLVSKLFVVKK